MAKKDTCIRKDELTQEPGYAQAVGQVGVSEDCCDYYNTDGPGPYPANPLAQIFAHQRKFMRRFSHLMPQDFNRLVLPPEDAACLTAQIDEVATCIAQEAAELRDWVPWKCWSQQVGGKHVHQANMWRPEHIHEMRVEVVDLVHFVVQAAILLGMDEHMLYDIWAQKARINNARQESGSY
jgi:hypothetical protein